MNVDSYDFTIGRIADEIVEQYQFNGLKKEIVIQCIFLSQRNILLEYKIAGNLQQIENYLNSELPQEEQESIKAKFDSELTYFLHLRTGIPELIAEAVTMQFALIIKQALISRLCEGRFSNIVTYFKLDKIIVTF